jgi:hypothetical protein
MNTTMLLMGKHGPHQIFCPPMFQMVHLVLPCHSLACDGIPLTHFLNHKVFVDFYYIMNNNFKVSEVNLYIIHYLILKSLKKICIDLYLSYLSIVRLLWNIAPSYFKQFITWLNHWNGDECIVSDVHFACLTSRRCMTKLHIIIKFQSSQMLGRILRRVFGFMFILVT